MLTIYNLYEVDFMNKDKICLIMIFIVAVLACIAVVRVNERDKNIDSEIAYLNF